MNRDYVPLAAWISALVIGAIMWYGLIKAFLVLFY